MKVSTVRVCLDCDGVFEGAICPDCAGKSSVPLSKYFKSQNSTVSDFIPCLRTPIKMFKEVKRSSL